MIIHERLFPFSSGLLGMTMLHPGFAERDYAKGARFYARIFRDDGEPVDVLETATLPGPASYPLPVILPECIAVADPGLALFSFRIRGGLNSTGHVFVGGMDLVTQRIVVEKEYKSGGLLGKLAGTPPIAMSRLLTLSGDGAMALFSSGMHGVYAVDLNNDLKMLFKPRFNEACTWFGTWIRGQWVVCPDGIHRKSILLLDEHSGEPRGEYSFKRTITSFATARDGGILVVGLMGGGVDIIDIDRQTQRSFRPHRGAERDDWSIVRVSADGGTLASKMMTSAELIITDLSTSRSGTGMTLEDRYDTLGENRKFCYVPDFGFVDGELLTLSQQTVTRYGVPRVAGDAVFIAEEKHPDYVRAPKFNPKQPLAKNLEKFGLGRVAEAIHKYWSPAARMILKRAGTKALPIGGSRLGGLPDLPDSKAWPRRDGVAMGFVAQINLEEFAAVVTHEGLPEAGLLSLFMRVDQEPFPLGLASDAGAWVVLYHPPGTRLQRCEQPEVPAQVEDFFTIDEAGIRFSKGGWVLPAEDSALVAALQLSADEKQNYIELITQVNRDIPDEEAAHQFMGHPAALQDNGMELACARASRGKDPFAVAAKDSPEFTQELQDSTSWTLLLQLDSDEINSNMLWGDAGLYYWFAPRDALQAQDFAGVWGQIQCH